MNKRYAVGCLGGAVCVSMLLSSLVLVLECGNATGGSSRGPIYINGNFNFTAANGVVGGSGTDADPYIIEGWTIDYSSGNAIEIGNTDAFFVIRHTVADGNDGIYLHNVTNARITDSVVTGDPGIFVEGGHYLVIEWNRVDSMAILSSSRIIIQKNSFAATGTGLIVKWSSDTLITENTISTQGTRAIYFWDVMRTVIHHNNLNSTGVHAYENWGMEDWWNETYPGGGNFWAGYSGVDDCSGPLQDVCPDPDGYGDTPYFISGTGADYYPLMERYETPPISSFDVTPASGTISSSFSVDASSTWDVEDPDTLIQVRWDWEDDGTWDTAWSTAKTAQHSYLAIGTYDIRLEAMDAGGQTNQTTRQVEVVNSPPVASFTIEPSIGDVETVFALNASSSSDLEDSPVDLVVRWDWQDDGIWDTLWDVNKTTTHQYTQSATYVVRMEIKDTMGAVGNATKELTVTPETTPPSRPMSLKAETGEEIGTVRLTWQHPNPVDVDHYDIYLYGSDAASVPLESRIIDDGDTLAFTFTGLEPGREYWFRISSSDASNNESPRTDLVSARAREEASSFLMLVVAAIIVIAILAALVSLLVLKRRKKAAAPGKHNQEKEPSR